MNLLNQVKVVVVTLVLENHIETTVEVELVSVINRLQVTIA